MYLTIKPPIKRMFFNPHVDIILFDHKRLGGDQVCNITASEPNGTVYYVQTP